MPGRTPEQIRASIEQNRQELGESLEWLRDEVTQLTDWRARLRPHQSQLAGIAVISGFVLGGGIAGIVGLLRGYRVPKRRGGRRTGAVKAVRGKLPGQK